jgi:hypothetical protein
VGKSPRHTASALIDLAPSPSKDWPQKAQKDTKSERLFLRTFVFFVAIDLAVEV